MIEKPKPRPKRHKQTIACDISPKVMNVVIDRDMHCIICGKSGAPNAHYIARSHGGLGTEENIVTLCQKCHHDYDNGDKREEYGAKIEQHLRKHYPDWDRSKLIYNKFKELDPAYRFDGFVK